MPATATAVDTLKNATDQAEPGDLPDALRLMKLGTMLTPLKRTFTGLTAAAAFDLTLIDGTGETAGVANANRVAALAIATLRVTASGTANSVGSYAISDTGGTPVSPTAGANVGLATISDNGKTVTFPTTVTAFVIEYVPRSNTDMTARFARA
jgi:hypothetical protein